MLVLTRKVGEKLMIGDNIVIELVTIRGDKCRIGITAPVETSIHRKEVYDAIQKERLAAQQTP